MTNDYLLLMVKFVGLNTIYVAWNTDCIKFVSVISLPLPHSKLKFKENRV